MEFGRLIAMTKNKSEKIIQAPMGKDRLQRIDATTGIVAENLAAVIRAAGQQRFIVSWILAGLILIPHLAHALSKNIERQQKMTDTPSTVQVGQAQKGHETQWASNAQGTLFGENMGDFIILQWDLNDNAAEYFVYRSTSLNAPWEQTGRFSQGAARTGGAKVHETPGCQTNGSVFQGGGRRCRGTRN
jgi:hypothetical protein